MSKRRQKIKRRRLNAKRIRKMPELIPGLPNLFVLAGFALTVLAQPFLENK